MRRLRIVTTVLLLLGVGIVLSYPWTVGARPAPSEPPAVKQAYAMRLFIVFTGASFSLVGAAICAMLMARRIRREYAEQSLRNLAELVSAAGKVQRAKEEAADEE